MFKYIYIYNFYNFKYILYIIYIIFIILNKYIYNFYNFKYIYIYIIFIILNYIYVHPVSNLGSHSTWYALIVPHISECWPEDGLIGPKHVATIKYHICKGLLCFYGKFKISFWLLTFKQNGMSSIKIIRSHPMENSHWKEP